MDVEPQSPEMQLQETQAFTLSLNHAQHQFGTPPVIRSSDMKNHRLSKPFIKSQHGIALFMVLWILALLTVIVGEFCHSMRSEINITRNFKEETEAAYIAHACINIAINELLKLRKAPPYKTEEAENSESVDEERMPWRINVKNPEFKFERGVYTVRIDNLSGKININHAEEPLLKLLFANSELSKDDIDALVNTILDWRDHDDDVRVSSAESEYYQGLDPPYDAKNGVFDSIKELTLLKYIKDKKDLFYDYLRDSVTIYPQKKPPEEQKNKNEKDKDEKNTPEMDYQKINLNAAPPEVLRLLPGIGEEEIEAITEFRKESDFTFLGELGQFISGENYHDIAKHLTLQLSPFYELNATAKVPETGAISKVRVVLKIDDKTDNGYRIIHWVNNPDTWSAAYMRGKIDLSGHYWD